jgi:hypothetical protein
MALLYNPHNTQHPHTTHTAPCALLLLLVLVLLLLLLLLLACLCVTAAPRSSTLPSANGSADILCLICDLLLCKLVQCVR